MKRRAPLITAAALVAGAALGVSGGVTAQTEPTTTVGQTTTTRAQTTTTRAQTTTTRAQTTTTTITPDGVDLRCDIVVVEPDGRVRVPPGCPVPSFPTTTAVGPDSGAPSGVSQAPVAKATPARSIAFTG